jgi:DNA polymerase sigma
MPNLVITNIKPTLRKVNVFKGKINDIRFDISINQIGGLASLYFLEAFASNFPPNYFKKLLIIAKAWARYDARILGSNGGCLKTYALVILVAHILNCYPFDPEPMRTFIRFIEVYSNFDWQNNVVTVCGTISRETYERRVLHGYDSPEEACEDENQYYFSPRSVREV